MSRHRSIFLDIKLLVWPALFAGIAATGEEPKAGSKLATFEEAMASKQDLWGLAAMNQPNGASYEFFEKLLPPLRYVNAAFHYYPIPLSAPNAPVKARLISNGSGLNLRGATRS